jgi:hypothetical protein
MSNWDNSQWITPVSGTSDQWITLISGTTEEQLLYVIGMEAALPKFDGGFSTLCGNSNKIYLGTNGVGIKYINKTDVVGLNVDSPPTLSGILYNYLIPPMITGFNIRYLHCNDNYLGVVTENGLDIIKLYKGYTHSKTYTSEEAYKCFVTTDGYLYYTLSGTSDWRINKTRSWAPPFVTYVTGSGILPAGQKLTDIFVTENTAYDKISNTIFCATTSGVYVIDENTDAYYGFLVDSSGEYNFNNVWADSKTNLSQGKMYVASSACLSVIDMRKKNIYSYNTQYLPGRNGTTLDHTPIIDINKV